MITYSILYTAFIVGLFMFVLYVGGCVADYLIKKQERKVRRLSHRIQARHDNAEIQKVYNSLKKEG